MNFESWLDLSANELCREIQKLYVWIEISGHVTCQYHFPDLEVEYTEFRVVHVCNAVTLNALYITRTNDPRSLDSIRFPIILLYDYTSNQFWRFSVYSASNVDLYDESTGINHFRVSTQLTLCSSATGDCIHQIQNESLQKKFYSESLLPGFLLPDLGFIIVQYCNSFRKNIFA